MTEQTRFDRVLPGIFDELAAAHTPDYLEAAIERASSRNQRPAWTYPGRWLPMQITTEALPTARGPWRLIGVLALIGLLIALAIAAYVGSRPTHTAPHFGLAGNGAIALAVDGDIVVADRPGGALRPLVAGPEDDYGPMFSADGTKLAFTRSFGDPLGEVLMVADADGTNIAQVPPLEPLPSVYQGRPIHGIGALSFAPDGRSIMMIAQFAVEKRVLIRPVDPTAATTILDIPLPGAWQDIEDPSFRPTNPQEILVVAELGADGQRGLYTYDLATDEFRTIVEPADDYVHDVAWLPDGEHIIYHLSGAPRVVAADGSGDQTFDAVRGRLSPVSNDGTRLVVERTWEGEASPDRLAVVRITGDGEPVMLACGPGTDIECATDWIWSPDDSMLIGTRSDDPTGTGEGPEVWSYQRADPDTGEVTQLDWDGTGTTTWQRVAP